MNPTDEPRQPLTDAECEQLLAGRDVPGSAAAGVFRALDASVQADSTGALPGESAALAAFRESRGTGRPHHRLTARIAAVGITGGIVLAGGVAAAATGHFGTIEHAFTGGSSHSTSAPTPSQTPPAGASNNSSSNPAAAGTAGQAHDGHGQGQGVGETAKPTHPTHPAHPSHPAHPTPRASHTPNTGNGNTSGNNGKKGSPPGATNTPTPRPSHIHSPAPQASKSMAIRKSAAARSH